MEALPPPEALFEPPLLLLGALVHKVTDTRPGVDSVHSVVIYGTVAEEVKAEVILLGSAAAASELLICYRLFNVVPIY